MADGSVKIDTKIDTKGVPGQLKNLGSVLKTGIASAAKIAGVALGALTASIVAVGAASKKFAETTDRIDKLSQAIGLSRESFQEWDYVLSQNGASIEGIKTGLKTMLEQAGVTDGAFSKLGITVTDLNGNMKSQEQLFSEAVKALQGIDDQTTKAALAQDLFSRASQDLMPLLNQTGESTDALRQKAHDLGIVLSDETVTAGVELTDSLDSLKRAGQGFLNNVIAPLIPKITNIITAITEWLTENDRLKNAMLFIGEVISFTFSFIKKAIGEVWIAWANIVTFFQTTGHRISGLFQNIGSTISLVFTIAFNSVKIALISFYELLTTKILGGVRTFIDVLGKLPFVGEQFNAASAAIGRVTDAITENVDSVKQASLDKIKAVAEERIATREAVDENIENVRREGDERIAEARRVAEAIERFSFNLKPNSDGEEESSSPVDIATSTSDWASAWKGLKKRGEDAGQITVEAIRKGIFNHLSTATRAAKDAVVQIGAGIGNAFRIVKTVISKAASFIKAIAFFDPQAMLDNFKNIIDGIKNFFLVDLPLLPVYFDAGFKIINDFINGMLANMDAILKTISNVINYIAMKIITDGEKIVAGFIEILAVVAIEIIKNLPILLKAVIKLILLLAIEIAKNMDIIVEAVLTVIPEIVVALIAAIPEILVAVTRVAYELVRGLIIGILNFGKNIFSAVAEVFINFWNNVLSFFGINSPSRLGLDLGGNIIQGIINGIKNVGAGIWNAVKGIFTGLWDNIVNVFSGAVNLGGSIVGGIASGISGLVGGVVDVASDIWDGITGWFASGTNSAPAGWAVVGEEGPELVQMGGGERIYPADQTAAILSAGAGVLSSISNGMNTGGGMITLINKMTGTVNVDGREIGRIAYENLDRFALS